MSANFDVERLETVQLVPPTPFTADSRHVVEEVLAQHLSNMALAGIRVFLPAAGTGEFHSLSVDEIVQCVKITRSTVGSDCLVVAPIGFGLDHALAIGRRAADVGANALLLMPPVHPYLSDEGFRDYVIALKTDLPLPLLAYKRGPVPSDSLLIELGEREHLIGVKYAANDLDAFNRFARAAPETLGLYCGTAERYAPFFALAGAKGFTSGAANLCPRLSLELHRLLATRRFDRAMEVLRTIRPIEDFRALENDSFNISAIKWALSFVGYDFGPPRPPQRRLNDEQQRVLRSVLESLLFAEQRIV